MERTGLSVWPEHPPAFFCASTRPEGKTVWGFWGFLESGSHWALSARQNPQSHVIYTYFIPYHFQIWSTFGYSTDGSTLQLNHFIAAGCCQSVRAPAEYLIVLEVWICQTPAAYIKIWADESNTSEPLLSSRLKTAAHLKLAHELCKDGEEGLRAGRLAVFSEEGGHLGELLHRSGLQGLQRLDRRVAVLQKALWVNKVTY